MIFYILRADNTIWFENRIVLNGIKWDKMRNKSNVLPAQKKIDEPGIFVSTKAIKKRRRRSQTVFLKNFILFFVPQNTIINFF